MPLGFNHALQAHNFNQRDVRLLRHQTRGDNGQTPFALWRDNPTLFEAYQGAQQRKNRNRLSAPFWASFIVPPDGRTLFAGLYSVVGIETVPEDWPYPITPRTAQTKDELYRLQKVQALSEFEGRLYIDWGLGTRTWIQRADQQDKPIVELASRFTEPEFPGFSSFCEPLSRIATLPSTWTAALAAARGVYLLTCPATKELYVGSAIGENGFYGRWCNYAVNGHGGNVKLKSRDPSDYQVSILEVAGSLDLDADILALEGRWKQKLQSRAMGLNAN